METIELAGYFMEKDIFYSLREKRFATEARKHRSIFSATLYFCGNKFSPKAHTYQGIVFESVKICVIRGKQKLRSILKLFLHPFQLLLQPEHFIP
jgi:hypothetical protein